MNQRHRDIAFLQNLLQNVRVACCVVRFPFFDAQHVTRILMLAIVLLFLTAGVALAAQPPDADVDFYAVESPEGELFTVGDPITLRLEVRHPTASQVELPVLDAEWGQFEVVSQTGQDTVTNGDGTATTRKDIVVTLFEPGSFQTPPLIVNHTTANGQPEELGAPVIPLKIDSILIEGDTELRDLKDQAELPVPPLWPLFLAGVVIAAAVIGGGYLAGQWAYNRWWRKQPIELAPQPVIDTRPPELIALTELERIEAMNLPAREQFKEHYSLVTDCLRDYIERRYHIPALEQTTPELRRAFAHAPIPDDIARKFTEMFTHSDLVKFARYKPEANAAYLLLPDARDIVQTTTPVQEPAPLAQSPAADSPVPPETEGRDAF
jgi:hypothetical protein